MQRQNKRVAKEFPSNRSRIKSLSSSIWNFGSNVAVALHWFEVLMLKMLKYSAAEKIIRFKYKVNNTWRRLPEVYIHIYIAITNCVDTYTFYWVLLRPGVIILYFITLIMFLKCKLKILPTFFSLLMTYCPLSSGNTVLLGNWKVLCNLI